MVSVEAPCRMDSRLTQLNCLDAGIAPGSAPGSAAPSRGQATALPAAHPRSTLSHLLSAP